jgi:hypothetical protein
MILGFIQFFGRKKALAEAESYDTRKLTTQYFVNLQLFLLTLSNSSHIQENSKQ